MFPTESAIQRDDNPRIAFQRLRFEKSKIPGSSFEDAWRKRIDASYGRSPAHWIDIDSLIEIKSRIDPPRHREDARILKMVRERRWRTR